MTKFQLWRRRSVLLAGLGLAGASLHNLASRPEADTSAPATNTPASTSQVQSTNDRNPASAPLKLGWSPWADAEVVSLMATQLIESELNQPVERVMADIGIQYQSVARGDLDLMLMAWLPGTHRDYWSKVRDRVLDLGPMYSGRLGWIVPDYVPEEVIASIEQLQDPQLAARFDGRVQGIDPGSGLNQASLKALKQYGLTSMELVASSSAAMAAVLAKAIDEQRWLIATSWTPHWMFARYKLRFLDDPKGSFGATERIHAVARQGLDQLHPAVIAFLSRFHLPESDLDGLLLQAQESSAETAVSTYLARHPNRVRYWTTGDI
jgi:glycine betaine/proline transport system substrate-binding protein